MDIKDSYLHSSLGVVKSLSITADKLTYNLADIANTSKTITMPLATTSANGLLSKEDKTKIDNIKDVVKHYTLAADKYLKIVIGTTSVQEFMITGGSTFGKARMGVFYSTYNDGQLIRTALKIIEAGLYEYYIDNSTEISKATLYIKNTTQKSYINILSFTGTYCDVTEVDSIPDTAVKHTDENILATVKELSQITHLSNITAGNSTLPIYFKEGVPTPITVGQDGSLFATVGTNPTWTTDFRTLGWYKISNPYTYDSEAKLIYHHYIKIASLAKAPLIYSLRFKVFEDVNYPRTGEWILQLNYYSSYGKCVSLSQIGPSNKQFKVYIDDKFDVYIQSDVEWASSLRFCIEINDDNKNAVYTNNWEQTTTQPANIIASIINNGVVRIAPDNTVSDNLNTNNEGYKQFFTSDYFKGALRGNADTTTKLLNARTLWGKSFDGTANISGDISNTGNITPMGSNTYSVGTADLGYARFYAKGSGQDIGLIAINTYDTEKPAKIGFIIGSGNVNRGIYDYTEEGWMMFRDGTQNVIFPKGNIGIGAYVPSEKLTVLGTASVSDTTKVDNLVITSTTGKSHITFSRNTYNYISMPSGGQLAIIPNGQSLSDTTGMVFNSSGIISGTDKKYSLGTSILRWNTVHANQFRYMQNEISDVPILYVGSANQDVTLMRVYSSDSADTNYKSRFGYSLKYIGTGTDNKNCLHLLADYRNSETQNLALCVNQLGNIGIRGEADNTNALSVTGTIYSTAGFKKANSSDSYVLLGGGSHKSISDFMLKSDELENNVTTITKSLQVTTDWMDTGISGSDLSTGTYIISMHVSSKMLDIWNFTWSGIMTWYDEAVNDSDTSEIYLHSAGHATTKNLYLRTVHTLRTNDNVLKLQIASSSAFSEATDVTFKFKRII